MDHSKHVPLNPDELTSTNLEGANIYGPDDSHIGDVSHFHGVGDNAEVVLDVGSLKSKLRRRRKRFAPPFLYLM